MSTDALPLPDLSALPDDPAMLRQLVLQLLQALQGERDQREKLQHHMDLLLRRLYGRSSEKGLFDNPSVPVRNSQRGAGKFVMLFGMAQMIDRSQTSRRRMTWRAPAPLKRKKMAAVGHQSTEGGLDALTVAVLMGHRKPSMLVRVYQQLSLHPKHLGLPSLTEPGRSQNAQPSHLLAVKGPAGAATLGVFQAARGICMATQGRPVGRLECQRG